MKLKKSQKLIQQSQDALSSQHSDMTQVLLPCVPSVSESATVPPCAPLLPTRTPWPPHQSGSRSTHPAQGASHHVPWTSRCRFTSTTACKYSCVSTFRILQMLTPRSIFVTCWTLSLCHRPFFLSTFSLTPEQLNERNLYSRPQRLPL